MKKIIVILLLCLMIPIGFGEEEDINVTILYEDGTVEVMRQSELDALGSQLSLMNTGKSAIITTAVSQPIYMTESHYNGYYDDWRLEYIKAKDILGDIEAELAGTTIKVAVLDSGVYRNHSDLNLLVGKDFANNDDDPHDYSGHGSHVAGIIGAKSSGDDITGVAPNVEILPIKVFSDVGVGGTDILAQGLRYAIDENVDVINISLRYLTYDSVIMSLLNEAEENGIVVVAATSNESNLWTNRDTYEYQGSSTPYGVAVGFPAGHDSVLAVGSISKNKLKPEVGISDYSNIKGQRTINGVLSDVNVDIVAPGDEIVSWSQYGDDVTVIKSGTSMSAPHVAGLAAILMDKYPSLSPAQIRAVIRDTAYDPSIVLPNLANVGASKRSDIIGQGLINVEEAMNYSPIHHMTLSVGEFKFDPKVLSYTVRVPYNQHNINLDIDSIEGASITLDSNGASSSEILSLSSASQTFVVEGTFGDVTKSYSITIDKALPELSSLTANGVSLDTSLNVQSYLESTDQVILNAAAPSGVTINIDAVEESSHTYDVTSPQNVIIELTSDETPARVNTYQLHLSKASDSIRLDSVTFNGTTINIDLNKIGDNTGTYDLGNFSYGTTFTASAVATSGGTITYSVNGGPFNNTADFTGSGLPLPGQESTLDVKVSDGGQYNIYYFNFERDHAILNSLNYTTMDPGEVSTIGHNLENNLIDTLTYEESSVRIDATANYPIAVTYKVNNESYDNSNTKSLNVGSNKVSAKIAFGTYGQADYEEVIYSAILTRSGTADIKTLTYQAKVGSDNIVLYKDEVFSTSDTMYDITLSNKMTSMVFDITPEVTDTRYTASLNGSDISLVNNDVVLGELSDGDHVLEIMNMYHYWNSDENIGEPGYSSKTYTYNIHIVSGLALSEVYLKSDDINQINFNEETLTYNVAVLAGTSNVFKAVKADASYGGMKWIVDGIESDYTGSNETLEFGKTYQLKIISPISSETRVYDINFTERSIDTNSQLSQLYVSGQSISPAFAGDVLTYSSQVSNDVSSVTINATKASQYASLKIEGQTVTNFVKDLVVGDNSVEIVVIAEDGSSTSYSVNINRQEKASSSSDDDSSSSSGSSFVYVPPSNEEKKDEVKTLKNKDGSKTVLVEVSNARIKEDIKDDTDSVQVKAEGNRAEVSMDLSTVRSIGKSDKTLDIEFDDVTFMIPNEIINKLDIRKSFKVSYTEVNNEDEKLVSSVFELDLYDGDAKLEIKEPIPVVLSYDEGMITNKEHLAVYFYDEKQDLWTYVGGKLLEGNQIYFEVRHFSKYAVRENHVNFEDISNHWAKLDIETIASREICSGISETEFAPDKTLTNAEFIVLLVKILDLPDYEGTVSYTNIEEDEWYTSFVKKAIGADLLINTYPVNFDPNEPIKREEMASLLMATYFYYTQEDPGKMLVTAVEFAEDEGEVSPHFRDVVRMAYQLQLITGDDKNHFNPKNGATRAEAAVVIKKLLKLMELL